MSATPPPPLRVAFLGFSDFERSALASYFRLTTNREPRYEPVYTLTDAELLVADADHAPSVQLVLVTERLEQTVFIGSHAPEGAAAAMLRPIDALHVMRALDAMVGVAPSAEPAPAVVVPAPRPPTAAPPTAASGTTHSVIGAVMAKSSAPIAPPAPPAPSARPVPLAPPVSRAPRALAAPELIGPPPPPRALLVDDSPIALRFLETRLKPWGLRTDRVNTSAQALQQLAERSYDLVFLDLELGPDSELDGLALCRQIKRTAAALNATLVMVSAHHSEVDRARGSLAGCDAYLSKPLKDTDLTQLLRRQGLPQPRPDAQRPRPLADAFPEAASAVPGED